MKYHEFIYELENIFLYEMCHIPYYGKIENIASFPFCLKEIVLLDGRVNARCSVFHYFDAYPFYNEGTLKGWSDHTIYIWAAWKMLDLFIERHNMGRFKGYEDCYDNRAIETLEGLAKEYKELCYAYLDNEKLMKAYADGIMKVIRQV